MKIPLRVLVLEDRAADAELAIRELQRAGFDPVWTRVDTGAAFEAALQPDLDVILADFRLPQYDGLQALNAVRGRSLDVPFILVTGTLGEETAVESIKQGATDFVLKDRMARLGMAVTRAIEARRLRRENERAAVHLRAAHVGLAESARRYRMLFDNLLNGYAHCRMIFDGDAPVDFVGLEVNSAFKRHTGLTVQEGRRVTELIPGIREAHPELFEIFGRVARGGPPEQFEFFFTPLQVWLSVAVYHTSDEHFVTVFDNVTERRKADDALRESQLRLQLAVAASNIGPWDWNLETNEVYFSPEWKRQLGYDDEEISAAFSEWESRLHPDDHDRISGAVQAYHADPSVGYDVEFRLRHKDGSYRWIRTRATLLFDDAGRAIRMLGCHVDITADRQAAADHERLAGTLRLILESAGEGIYGVDAVGRCTFVNGTAADALGWKTEDLLGREMHSLVHHSRADGEAQAHENCPIRGVRLSGVAARVEGDTFWRSDGTSFPVDYSASPMLDGGRVVGAVVTFADVTGKRELEAQLRQAQKLEAIGHLTGGVAHDFNNLLTAILGYTNLVAESLEPESQALSDLREIKHAGARAATLTRQLLAFSRRQVLEPKIVDLNGLVSDLVQLLRRLIGEHIELDTRLAADLLATKVDPGQMEQVILNLVVNGRDAMPDGGRLIIETANVAFDEKAARTLLDAQPGAYVRLRVRDTGVGMDEAVRKRIFEPFFTTKALGKGSGLGLATVYGIVRQSAGVIELESQVGHGTTFDVYLPVAAGPVEARLDRAALAHREGTETILLVEDDDAVRRLTRRMLEGFGYRVLEADCPAEARAAADRTAGIDLLVTDVLMPGGTGPDLYRDLALSRPGLAALFISGYSEDLVALQKVMDTQGFLQKPFDAGRLSQKVREILDASPAAG